MALIISSIASNYFYLIIILHYIYILNILIEWTFFFKEKKLEFNFC